MKHINIVFNTLATLFGAIIFSMLIIGAITESVKAEPMAPLREGPGVVQDEGGTFVPAKSSLKLEKATCSKLAVLADIKKSEYKTDEKLKLYASIQIANNKCTTLIASK